MKRHKPPRPSVSSGGLFLLAPPLRTIDDLRMAVVRYRRCEVELQLNGKLAASRQRDVGPHFIGEPCHSKTADRYFLSPFAFTSG